MFEKILVPIDGSEESKKAVFIAKELVEKFQAEAFLIYVLPPLTLVATAAPGEEKILEVMPELIDFRQREAKEILNEFVGLFPPGKAEQKLLEGHPARCILNFAKEGNFDLIVIGSRGMSGIAGFLLGSVSDAVVHHAHCPVLVVR
jgi:nucleotide-binding universal stress UspA family protein